MNIINKNFIIIICIILFVCGLVIFKIPVKIERDIIAVELEDKYLTNSSKLNLNNIKYKTHKIKVTLTKKRNIFSNDNLEGNLVIDDENIPVKGVTTNSHSYYLYNKNKFKDGTIINIIGSKIWIDKNLNNIIISNGETQIIGNTTNLKEAIKIYYTIQG